MYVEGVWSQHHRKWSNGKKIVAQKNWTREYFNSIFCLPPSLSLVDVRKWTNLINTIWNILGYNVRYSLCSAFVYQKQFFTLSLYLILFYGLFNFFAFNFKIRKHRNRRPYKVLIYSVDLPHTQKKLLFRPVFFYRVWVWMCVCVLCSI